MPLFAQMLGGGVNVIGNLLITNEKNIKFNPFSASHVKKDEVRNKNINN